MSYPSERADSLELYVRKAVSLSGKAHHLYGAMRWLEREKSGLCRKVIARYRDIASHASIDIKSVKSALQELQTAGLIELTIGSAIKSDHLATVIRRKTLDEIKMRFTQGDDNAHRLATALSGRTFYFVDKIVKPCWTVGVTGRLSSSDPNIQGTKGKDSARVAGLKPGLKQGQILVHADIRQAEPMVILNILKMPLERDLYQEYANATGCSRDNAKTPVNTLAYCKNSLACFNHWPEPAQSVLRDYVEKLADYKAMLFATSRRTRTVTTHTGRSMVAVKGRHFHAGIAMNWRVQGTIADIVNDACLRLLDCASVIVPVHDAVYAILPVDKAGIVEVAITEKVREIGLSLQIKVAVHHG